MPDIRTKYLLHVLTKGLFINYVLHIGGQGVLEKITLYGRGGLGVSQKMTDDNDITFVGRGTVYLVKKHYFSRG